MIYNITLFSHIQHSDLYIYIYIFLYIYYIHIYIFLYIYYIHISILIYIYILYTFFFRVFSLVGYYKILQVIHCIIHRELFPGL